MERHFVLMVAARGAVVNALCGNTGTCSCLVVSLVHETLCAIFLVCAQEVGAGTSSCNICVSSP